MAAPGQQRVEQYPYFTWPPIHSLGVILLEIELVDCIDRAVQDYGFLSESTGRPKQNAELFAAEYAVKCDHILDNDETYPEVASSSNPALMRHRISIGYTTAASVNKETPFSSS